MWRTGRCPDCFLSGRALDCYSCTSQVSWEDCARNLKKGTCAPNLDNCAKLYARGNGEVFARGCDTSYECSNQLTCKGLELNECTLHCCKDDFCNGTALTKISSVILVFSLLASVNAMWLPLVSFFTRSVVVSRMYCGKLNTLKTGNNRNRLVDLKRNIFCALMIQIHSTAAELPWNQWKSNRENGLRSKLFGACNWGGRLRYAILPCQTSHTRQNSYTGVSWKSVRVQNDVMRKWKMRMGEKRK